MNVILFGNRVFADDQDDVIRIGLIQHDCIPIKRRDLNTEIDRYTGRPLCEDEGRNLVDSSAGQRMAKTVSKSPEARREA